MFLVPNKISYPLERDDYNMTICHWSGCLQSISFPPARPFSRYFHESSLFLFLFCFDFQKESTTYTQFLYYFLFHQCLDTAAFLKVMKPWERQQCRNISEIKDNKNWVCAAVSFLLSSMHLSSTSKGVNSSFSSWFCFDFPYWRRIKCGVPYMWHGA